MNDNINTANLKWNNFYNEINHTKRFKVKFKNEVTIHKYIQYDNNIIDTDKLRFKHRIAAVGKLLEPILNHHSKQCTN